MAGGAPTFSLALLLIMAQWTNAQAQLKDMPFIDIDSLLGMQQGSKGDEFISQHGRIGQFTGRANVALEKKQGGKQRSGVIEFGRHSGDALQSDLTQTAGFEINFEPSAFGSEMPDMIKSLFPQMGKTSMPAIDVSMFNDPFRMDPDRIDMMTDARSFPSKNDFFGLLPGAEEQEPGAWGTSMHSSVTATKLRDLFPGPLGLKSDFAQPFRSPDKLILDMLNHMDDAFFNDLLPIAHREASSDRVPDSCAEDVRRGCRGAVSQLHCLGQQSSRVVSESCLEDVGKSVPFLCSSAIDKWCDVSAGGVLPCLTKRLGQLDGPCQDSVAATRQILAQTRTQRAFAVDPATGVRKTVAPGQLSSSKANAEAAKKISEDDKWKKSPWKQLVSEAKAKVAAVEAKAEVAAESLEAAKRASEANQKDSPKNTQKGSPKTTEAGAKGSTEGANSDKAAIPPAVATAVQLGYRTVPQKKTTALASPKLRAVSKPMTALEVDDIFNLPGWSQALLLVSAFVSLGLLRGACVFKSLNASSGISGKFVEMSAPLQVLSDDDYAKGMTLL